jgi:hypothetical protein
VREIDLVQEPCIPLCRHTAAGCFALARVPLFGLSFSQLGKNPGRRGRGQKFGYVGFISRANGEFVAHVVRFHPRGGRAIGARLT